MKKTITFILMLAAWQTAIAQGRDTGRFTATFTGRSEFPPNASANQGIGKFTLETNTLTYLLRLNDRIRPTFGGIYEPAHPRARASDVNFVADLGHFTVFIPGPDGNGGLTPGGLVYHGQIILTDDQVEKLKRGELFVNFTTLRYPEGELRGTMFPDHSRFGVFRGPLKPPGGR